MSFLGFGRKTKSAPRRRRKLTADDKLKSIASKDLTEVAGKDASVRASLIKKHFNIDVTPEDESREREKDLRGEFYSKLLKKYREADENTEYTEREEEVLDRILGTAGGQGRPRYGDWAGGEGVQGPGDMEEMADMYERMEARFGGRGGMFSFLKHPEVATALIGFINNLFGKGQALPPGNNTPGGRIYTIEVDGEMIEMSEEVYQAYLSQQKKLKAAEARALGVGKKETEDKGEAADKPGAILQKADDGSEVLVTPIYADKKSSTEAGATPLPENILQYLPIAKEISEAMDGDPEQFAIALVSSANEGHYEAYGLVAFLKTMTYDKILELLEPYKSAEELTEYMEKLEQNKGWVQTALSIISELPLTEPTVLEE